MWQGPELDHAAPDYATTAGRRPLRCSAAVYPAESGYLASRAAIKQRFKRVVGQLLRPLSRERSAEDLIILNYHSVDLLNAYSTTPTRLREQIDYALRRYETVSLEDWCRGYHAPSGRPGFAVTFDDGYENFYQHALPVIRDARLPSVLFVTTGLLENPAAELRGRLGVYAQLTPLRWSSLEQIAAAGVTIGSHTHTHRDLGTARAEAVREELTVSRDLLREHLGREVTLFAYPWGQRRNIPHFSAKLLEESGYVAGCSTIWGVNGSRTPKYLLRRIRIDPWDSLDDFAAKIDGKWDFIRWWQG